MAAKLGSFRQSSGKKSKDWLLSRKGYSELELGSSDEDDERVNCEIFCSVIEHVIGYWNGLQQTVVNIWKMGQSDIRKVFFAAKMAFSLAIVSMLIFLDEPRKNGNLHSIWAILTVVLVFEFTVGATLDKGFNRALGTLSAGGLALVLGELFLMAGEMKVVYMVICTFVAGLCATYAKLYPTMKPYEYGFRVFLLTYCIIMASGCSSSNFFHTAFIRLVLIAVGACVSVVINTCIYPIWAGDDLHKLLVRNFKGVSTSLEGCINGYLHCIEYVRISSKILKYQASDDPVYSGYRSVMQSRSEEESLVAFAIWEPPHGRYRGFNYPWEDYMKVGDALRHCTFMVLAMHGCILSEIRASPEKRQVFAGEIQRVGAEGAKVLQKLGEKIEKMEKLSPGDDILFEVHEAAEDLQLKIDQNSYLLVNSDTWEASTRNRKKYKGPHNFHDGKNDINKQLRRSHSQNIGMASENMFKREFQWPSRISFDSNVLLNEQEVKTYESASSLSLATFVSLLIEFVARLQKLVDSFQELSEKANF